ncbi:C-type lectin domain family 2 member F-like [Rana temporaria]|uniref:C-type lectin domain family 2 member F-like n=1 Tax=Rana temporaria TaxID=8407 RepID=UPI001AADF451|nr:C-type lectin domain family 2 member F-like [Rana temporaria]
MTLLQGGVCFTNSYYTDTLCLRDRLHSVRCTSTIKMGFGKHQPKSDDQAEEKEHLTPLTDSDSEKTADNPKEHMKKHKGTWQKLKSPRVPRLYVLIGSALSVTLITIFIALLFVREKTPETRVVESPICVQCEDDWILYRGKCYYLSDQIDTWTDSQDFCKSHNSSLAIIDNEKEKNFFNLLNSNNYWIGLSRTQDDSGWVWTDGTFYSETIFYIGRRPIEPGESENVYLNGEGFKSDSGRYPRKWICSKSFLGHSPEYPGII